MHWKLRVNLALPAVIVCLFWATALPAQVLYRGEMDRNAAIDSADLVSLLLVLNDPANSDPLLFLLADANDDESVDSGDVDYLTAILLGSARPLPLLREYGGAPVSFAYLPSPREAGELDTVSLGAASFFYQPRPRTEPAERDVVQLGTASFLFRRAEITEVTERNAVLLGAASFYYSPQEIVQVREVDAIQVGTPSFYFTPPSDLAATEDSVVQTGTPSFERQ